MTELTKQSKNRLEQGEMVSQELKPTKGDLRRWIAIYPLAHERMKNKYEGFKYKVIDFELDKNLIDEFFSEEDKKNLREYLITSEVELSGLFSDLDIDLKLFDVPWKNDYPL